MTSCAECLTALSSMRLADLSRESGLVTHCSQCPTCSAVLSEFQLAERRLAITLAELRPLPPSAAVAREAILGSEKFGRRIAARWFRAALAITGLVLLGSYVREEIWLKRWPFAVTETISLRCMPPDAATALVTPYLRSGNPAVYSVPGAQAITIRGNDREAARAISELKTFESKFCGLPPLPGADVNRGGELPGND